jgi:tetratricopeptide (TPR) repeat protein
LAKDFTFWGIFLGILGLWGLWRGRRRLFWLLVIGILVSGPLFLVYANFPLKGGFSQATIIRFNLLSELFVTISLAIGLLMVWEKVKNFTRNKKDKTNLFAQALVIAILALVFLFPLATHFKSVDQRQNTFSYEYGQVVLNQIENDAILMLSGDVPNFVIDYLRFVEDKGGNRIIFSPGQLHMSWFVKQLKERYPELKLPMPYPGYRFTVTHQIIEANWDLGRPIYIMPELSELDPVVGQNYLLWPQGLMFRVLKKDDQPEVEKYLTYADRLWQGLEPRKLVWVTKYQPNLDSGLYFYYSRHFFNLGFRLEEAERYQEAIQQYERTLEIDPGFAQAYKSMGTIYGYKLEEKDEWKAIENLDRYLNFVSDMQEAQAVRQAIWELSQPEEATESGLPKEATMSGEPTEATEGGKMEELIDEEELVVKEIENEEEENETD